MCQQHPGIAADSCEELINHVINPARFCLSCWAAFSKNSSSPPRRQQKGWPRDTGHISCLLAARKTLLGNRGAFPGAVGQRGCLLPCLCSQCHAPNKAHICTSGDFTVPSLVCFPSRKSGMSPALPALPWAWIFPLVHPSQRPASPQVTLLSPSPRLAAPGSLELPAGAVPPLWVWMRSSAFISPPAITQIPFAAHHCTHPALSSPHTFTYLLIYFLLPGNLC